MYPRLCVTRYALHPIPSHFPERVVPIITCSTEVFSLLAAVALQERLGVPLPQPSGPADGKRLCLGLCCAVSE